MSDHNEADFTPDPPDLAAALEELQAAMGPVTLDDDALWVEPDPGLERRVLDVIEAAPSVSQTPSRGLPGRWRRNWWVPASVAAAIVGLIAVVSLRSPAPDWVVALAPTEVAGVVEAEVSGWNERSGTRLQLDVTGLEAAPAGFFYELWFSDGPVHISAGTFREPDDVTLWVGVTRAEFPRLWITLEPIDDDPSPGLNLLDTEA